MRRVRNMRDDDGERSLGGVCKPRKAKLDSGYISVGGECERRETSAEDSPRETRGGAPPRVVELGASSGEFPLAGSPKDAGKRVFSPHGPSSVAARVRAVSPRNATKRASRELSVFGECEDEGQYWNDGNRAGNRNLAAYRVRACERL